MNTISAMTFNIHSAIGRDDKVNVGRIVDTIRDIDIVALQEVDNHWERSGNVSQVDLIAAALPQHFHAWHPVIDLWKTPSIRRQYGNLLLSRFPIRSVKRHALPKSVQPERLGLQCGVLEAIIAAPFGDLRVFATHVVSSDSARQIGRLLDIYATSSDEGAPISGTHDDATWFEEEQPFKIPVTAIILGDLNIRPGSEEYRRVTGAIPNSGVPLLVDAWSKCHDVGAPISKMQDSDGGATYLVDYDRKIGERLDLCFVSADMADRVLGAEVLNDCVASDHQPLRIVIDARPSTTGAE
ncbi:endonuclease/exonuclease/phosphatase family protein [Rhizobium sp.]